MYKRMSVKKIRRQWQESRLVKTTIIVLILLLLVYLFLINSAHDRTGLKPCYRRKENSNNSIQYLIDVMDADKMPVPGQGIFFYITTCFESGHIDLKPREACAIESAAKLNPNRDVFVLFISPVGFSSLVPKTVESILKYPNVHLRNNDMWKYADGTPLEKWFSSDTLFHSNYLYEHMADVLRFLTLFKFGGIYSDTDVVVMKNFDDLGSSNFAGDDWGDVVGCSVLGLDSTGLGHKIAAHCLNEIVEHYNGKEFLDNGPWVLTRTLNHLCRTSDRKLWSLEQCHGFKLLPINEFFPVAWKDWLWYFNSTFTQDALEASRDSTLIHVWNDRSKNERIEFGSNTAYELIAEKNCPIVYSTSDHL